MEDNKGDCQVTEETAVDFEIRHNKNDQQTNNNRSTWTNGQCVAAIPLSSTFIPRFDLSLCHAKLERHGFEVPARDLEDPLKIALDVPSVRRYMVFNSGLFHFILAPVLYLVLWCAVFSTLHLYITVTNYWILILSVSLISILLTTAILFILHHSKKEINVNIDVRLVQVNERMMKHNLLVGVADWVQNCTGHMQLYFVYWDMSHCLRTLTNTLEESTSVTNETQKTMKSRMSHLVLVTELRPIDPEAGGSDVDQDCDENRPLLRNEDTRISTPSGQRGDSKITSNYSLVPEALLPAEAKACQLLMTYSAAYVKLLVSERLSGPSNHRLRPLRTHCATAPICLCQYIRKKVLQ